MPISMETELLKAARTGDHEAFSALVEPHRKALIAHCYRFLGSLQDAEDIVQETLLRAWQRLTSFEGRAPLRAWLYRIATNACLDAIDKRPKRTLPSATRPVGDPQQPVAPPLVEPIWLEPFPDDFIADAQTNPEARYLVRESISLAFVAALQFLSPGQRVVLILRDVLDWRAHEVAETLDVSLSAVNSALHRARTALAKYYQPNRLITMAEPTDSQRRALLDRYVHAWENADLAELMTLLQEETIFNMPPLPGWYTGIADIGLFFTKFIFTGAANRWRLLPTRANGQAAFALYQYNRDDGAYHAFAIQVLNMSDQSLLILNAFMTPTLVKFFGLPMICDANSFAPYSRHTIDSEGNNETEPQNNEYLSPCLVVSSSIQQTEPL